MLKAWVKRDISQGSAHEWQSCIGPLKIAVRSPFRPQQNKATRREENAVSIKCGNRKFGDHRHETVDEVRACFTGNDLPIIHGATKSVAPAQVVKSAEHYADIPAGYYATESRTGNNDLDFWKVDKPTEGNWAGYIFVNRVIGGRPDIAIRKNHKFQVLEDIRAAGPLAAMQLYGQTIGKCGVCGRHLTDEISRFIGIGPVCRDKAA